MNVVRLAAYGQCLGAVALLGGLALRAPEDGPLGVGRLGLAAPAAVANVAAGADATLLGAGPLPGSLVVRGDRRTLEPAFWNAGALVVSGPASGCGDGATVAA
jgi:hypothetical protein